MEGTFRSLLNSQAETAPLFFRRIRGLMEDLPGLGGATRIQEVAVGRVALLLCDAKSRSSVVESSLHTIATYHDTIYSTPAPSVASVPWTLFASQSRSVKEPSEARLSAGQLSFTPPSTSRRRLPYPALIRALLESEEVGAARTLLAAALGDEPFDPYLLRMRDLLAPPVATKSAERDFDRTPEYQWLRTNAVDHQDRWVALDGEYLVADAKTLRELLHKLKGLRLSNRPLVHRVE